MMKSMLYEIEKLKGNTDNELEEHALTECLMQGSKSRKYVPLMNRQKCGKTIAFFIYHNCF